MTQAFDSESTARTLSAIRGSVTSNPLSIRERILAKRAGKSFPFESSGLPGLSLEGISFVVGLPSGPWLAPRKKLTSTEEEFFIDVLDHFNPDSRAHRRAANLDRLGSQCINGRPRRFFQRATKPYHKTELSQLHGLAPKYYEEYEAWTLEAQS